MAQAVLSRMSYFGGCGRASPRNVGEAQPQSPVVVGPGLGLFVQGFLRVGTGSAFAEIAVLREGSLMSQLPGFAESSVSRLLGVVISWVVVWEPSLGPCVRGFGGWMLIASFWGVQLPLSFAEAGRQAGWLGQTCPSCTGCGVAILARSYALSLAGRPRVPALEEEVGLGCSRQVFQSPQDPH